MLEATCHCGAVRLEIAAQPETLTACNCSICHRLGVQWVYYKQRQINIDCADDALNSYRWQSKRIEFCSCKTCGCTTHYVTVKKSADGHIAINARNIDPELLTDVPVRTFDGAKTWKFLDE